MKKSAIIHSNGIIFKAGAPRPYEFLYKKIGKEKLYLEMYNYYERHKVSGPLLLKETIYNLKGISFKDYKFLVREYCKKYSNPSISILIKFLKQKKFIPVICASNPIDFYEHLPVSEIFAAKLDVEDRFITGKYAQLTFPYKLDSIFYQPNRYGLLASFYFWAIKNKIDLSWTILIGPSIPAYTFSYFLGKIIHDRGRVKIIEKEIEKFIMERKKFGR